MSRAYRVKEGRQITDRGVLYLPGSVVYLDAEKAYFHAASIEAVFDIPDEPDPPFEAEIYAYKGQDFEQDWVVEAYVLEIDTIVPSTLESTITTKLKHFLATGDKINLRIISETITEDLHTTATVTGAKTLTVPYKIELPEEYEIAEVGKPENLTGDNFTGKVYNYTTEQQTLTFNGEFKCENGTRRITLTSKSVEELDNLKIGDLFTCTPAGLSAAEVVARSEIISARPGYYTRAYHLNAGATSDATTEQAFASRTIITRAVGGAISGAVFSFDSSLQEYGIISASMSKTVVATLPEGQLPFELIKNNELVLINGVLNVG